MLVHLVKNLVQVVFFANHPWVIVDEFLQLLVILALFFEKINIAEFVSVELLLLIRKLLVLLCLLQSGLNLLVFLMPIKIGIHVHYFYSLDCERLDEGV